MPESNRRVDVRHASLVFYDLLHAHNGERFGDLVDLSHGGLLVACEEPVTPGARLSLRMDIAARMLGTRTVAFDAECRWCSRAEPQGYACGLQVLQADDAGIALPHLAPTMVYDALRAF